MLVWIKIRSIRSIGETLLRIRGDVKKNQSLSCHFSPFCGRTDSERVGSICDRFLCLCAVLGFIRCAIHYFRLTFCVVVVAIFRLYPCSSCVVVGESMASPSAKQNEENLISHCRFAQIEVSVSLLGITKAVR